ncbi:protein translocase subunit SecF [Paenibacillus sp. 1011MAR3C5]|uniref:protein translocase subunit SecF n=1 Tax=Paenibacillus sp. 1011MAR3C5 TaxID=1675787 RepID=UPI000E6B9306|nr:protein translocase subunit SecF [Paenibacillus sp. 1011MAR3C5]RJE91017.1 protein translocase subunit SecF [Paenibacillus sp. 1011MAR3C5]
MNYETKIRYDVVGNRNKFLFASLAATLIGILSLFIFQLNLGIDFKAGSNMDVSTTKAVTQQEVNDVLKSVGYESLAPTVGGQNNDRISIRFNDVLDQSESNAVTAALKAKFGEDIDTEVNVVSPDIARELGIKTIWAILIASLGIMLYVMIRFEWRFALAANISILYDSFIVVAVFSIFRFEVDLPFIAAVLTTLGYSINDKIVIFDRIRENLRFASVKNESQLAELVNASIWQTMARNLYTVLTVVIVTVCIFLLGSPSIKMFSLALLVGLISGAYSTIFVASPLWYLFKRNQKQKPKVAAKPTP